MTTLDKLRKLTNSSTHRQHKLSCVIIKQGKPIAFGFNQLKSHTNSPHKFKSIHAEVDALFKLRKNSAEGCTAYVYREDRHGHSALAKPCSSCSEALRSQGIKRVYYSTKNGWEQWNLK